MQTWLKKRWRKGAKWLLLAVSASVIAFLVSHYGEEILGNDPDPASALRVVAESSLVNPEREDTAKREYVCVANEGQESVSLTAWKLYDAVGRVNEFSRFSLGPGRSVRVHPGGRPQPDTAFDVYGSEDRPRWTNSGDTIVLRDAEDEKVESQSYPNRGEGDVSGRCGPRVQRVGPRVRPDWDCSAFSSHAQAQAFFLAHGGPRRDRYELDSDGDGLACE